MSKYQKYRARLKDEFLLVGEGSGCSLPADARKTEFTDSGTTEFIHFGDATEVPSVIIHRKIIFGQEEGNEILQLFRC
jgi:hypothetical protein